MSLAEHLHLLRSLTRCELLHLLRSPARYYCCAAAGSMGHMDVPLDISDFPIVIANSPASWRHTMGPIVSQDFDDKGRAFCGV